MLILTRNKFMLR